MFTIKEIKVVRSRSLRIGEGKWNKVGSACGKSLIYVWVEDETVLEQFANRRSRPTKIYREVINQVREQIETSEWRTPSSISPYSGEEQGNHVIPKADLSDFVWKQTAGCACGCSPAFVVNSDRGKTIYITVSGVENPVDEVVVNRAQQLIGVLS